MFRSTGEVLLLDHFRVPYRVDPLCGRPEWSAQNGSDATAHELVDEVTGRRLSWLSFSGAGAEERRSRRYLMNGQPLFARVASDALVGERLERTSGKWAPLASNEISLDDGEHLASIWEDDNGNKFLPFDPNEVLLAFLSEAYTRVGSSSLISLVKAAALKGYYLMKPVIPRSVQLALRRRLARTQERTSFPNWPVETALHDFCDWFLERMAELAGRPVPWIGPWPGDHSWALVLTHDVETDVGQRNLHLLRDVETAMGYRSSWNFVPARYEVDESTIRDLAYEGFEIGVHGLHHDGRDIADAKAFEHRLASIQDAAKRWGARGFRSPATHRVWERMPRLGFDYDSSYPDTDPYEPQPGGCCSYLPFFIDDMVELPITLPQDHTIFMVLGRSDGGIWLDKARTLKERGGMALVLTHPDYALEPRLVDAYRELLERYHADRSVWKALPREVSEWWRRRASSTIEWDGHDFSIVGPASTEGRIRFTFPST